MLFDGPLRYIMQVQCLKARGLLVEGSSVWFVISALLSTVLLQLVLYFFMPKASKPVLLFSLSSLSSTVKTLKNVYVCTLAEKALLENDAFEYACLQCWF